MDFQVTLSLSLTGTGQEGSGARAPSPGEAGAPFAAGRRGTRPPPTQAGVKRLPPALAASHQKNGGPTSTTDLCAPPRTCWLPLPLQLLLPVVCSLTHCPARALSKPSPAAPQPRPQPQGEPRREVAQAEALRAGSLLGLSVLTSHTRSEAGSQRGCGE